MITYHGPIGEAVENPTYEFLENLILLESDNYWKHGGGDSCIEVEGCDERLIFFYDEPYGFFIMRHPDYLVLCDDSIIIETVEHLVGGEPMQVPSCSYVSRAKAFELIMSFVKEKKIPDFVEWVDLYDIDFQYEF